jgi:DNA repair photolyase
MRWDNLRSEGGAADPPALFGADAVVRRFDTPEFRGMTFYEVHARSIVNRVPAISRVPFRWTVNPYRGCSHACRYCFARNTHTYLDLDAGADFDSRIVVKVNAAALLRRALTAPSWRGETIAMGTNTDPYQRVEGRYRLMPGIIEALTQRANPFSVLTKGTLILRDLDLLRRAAAVTEVSAAVSVGYVDAALWRAVEPGTPSPRARLEVCARLTGAGIGCAVLMAPVLPYLTDSVEQLEATVAAIAAAGARSVSPIALHLRPGAREWYLKWLAGFRPDLVPTYERLYARGAYPGRGYQRRISGLVAELAAAHGIAPPPGRTRFTGPGATLGVDPDPAAAAADSQLELL